MDGSHLFRTLTSAIAITAALSGFTSLAFAQEEEVEVEEIVVTGSRIQRATDANSATPITVFDAAQLKQSGQTTLEDFLQEIPSVTGGQLGASANNGNPGLATVSLRGLGSARTLILLNGRRLSSSGQETGTVDLNTIPTSIIERIEVLRDGASTIYGSDAIAGVINIITKQSFEGAEIQLDAGTSHKNDGQQYLAAMTFGASSESGHVVLNAQYTKRQDIFQSERRFSECPRSEENGSIFCSGSGTTSPAQFFSDSVDFGQIVDPNTGMVRPYNDRTDAYNFATSSYLITPQEVATIYGYGEHELWNWEAFTTTEAFSELLFANRRSNQLLAPEGTFFGPIVAATNPFNPVDEDVVIARRLTETGGRAFSQDLNTWRGVIGIKGEIINDWQWDISYNYSHWVDTQIDSGRANPSRFNTLLDEAACNADMSCPGTWNPFKDNTFTQAMQDYALVTNSPVEKSTLRSLQANLVGDFGNFSLASEPFQWALGYEHRAERLEVTADGAAALGQIYAVSGVDWGGSYRVDEIYGELVAPLLEGHPGAELLSIEGSFRYSDYNASGSHTTFAGVIEYAPIEQLRFRGTYAEGFRAPGINERFLPLTPSAETYTDPCNNWGASNNPVIQANCLADGLPSNINLSNKQASGLQQGNANLKPEESESWTLGLVWTPTFIEDINFTLDYFKITIDNAIGTFTTNTIVRNCYESPDFSSPSCDLIKGAADVGLPPFAGTPRRQANGTIAGQRLMYQNISTFETSGVDLGADYSMDLAIGAIKFSASATYLNTWKYQASSFDREIDLAGYFGADPVTTRIVAFPEWKLFFNAGYEQDTWSASAILRMLGEVDDIAPTNTDLRTHIGNTWYTDINASFFGWEDVNISGGIRNLFNQQPPYVTNNDDMNTLQLNYDTVGRFFYGSVTFSF